MAADSASARTSSPPSRDHSFSPRELASAIGVSESSMKRWIDAGEVVAARTAGGHRRVSRREAVRFIRERGFPLADLSALRMPELAGVPRADASGPVTADTLVEAFQAGDAGRARALIVAEYVRGESVAVLCDGLMRETLQRIGKLWREHDRVEGIGVEHEVTDTFIHALGQVRSLVAMPGPDAPVAVGGAIAGDPYIIPSLMAATVLEDLGFDVTNLGPDTPAEVLAATAQRRKADLVWCSVSTDASLETLQRESQELVSRFANPGVRVIVGGRKANEESLPGLTVLPSMQALTAVAEQILDGWREEA